MKCLRCGRRTCSLIAKIKAKHKRTQRGRRRSVFLLFRATQSEVSIYAGVSPTSPFNLLILIWAFTHVLSVHVCASVRVCVQRNWRTVSHSSDLNWWNRLTSCLCSVSLCSFSLLFPHRSLDTRTHTHSCMSAKARHKSSQGPVPVLIKEVKFKDR